MTRQEYKRVQCPAILEPFWIGQGYGYKNMSPLLRTESWSGVPAVSYTHLMPQDFESYVEAKEYGDEMFGEGNYTIESPC